MYTLVQKRIFTFPSTIHISVCTRRDICATYSTKHSKVPDLSRNTNSTLLPLKSTPRSRPIVDPDYKMIYKYPDIEKVRVISKMKIYSAFSNICMLPPIMALEYFEKIAPDSTIALGILGSTLTLTFCIVGLLINKFIGIVYYNFEKDMLKIASLSYTGIRKDDYVPRTHLSHVQRFKWFPLLSKVSDTANEKDYKMIAQSGIIDPIVYNSIFNVEPISQDSKPLSESNELPPSQKDVDFGELIKKIQSKNESSKKEQ